MVETNHNYDFNSDDLIEYAPINSDDIQSKSSIWTKKETLSLINAYEQYKESFTHVKQRKHAWELISTHLQALDIMKTSKDCSLKWNNLTRTYKVAKDNRHKTGRGPIKFEHFNAMDDILGTKDSNAAEGVGVNVGASTSGMEVLIDEVDGRNNTADEPASKEKRRRLSYRELYYKKKIEVLEKKEKRQEELLQVEKEKLDI